MKLNNINNVEPNPSISAPKSSIQIVEVKYKKAQDKYLKHINKILSKEDVTLKDFREVVQFITKNKKFFENKIILMNSIQNKLISFHTLLNPLDLSWKQSDYYLNKLFDIKFDNKFDKFKKYKWAISIETKFIPIHHSMINDKSGLYDRLIYDEITEYIPTQLTTSYENFFKLRSNLFYVPTFTYKNKNSWITTGFSAEGFNNITVNVNDRNIRLKDIIKTLNLLITDSLISIYTTNSIKEIIPPMYSDLLIFGKNDEVLNPNFTQMTTVPEYVMLIENMGTYNLNLSLPSLKIENYMNKININNKKYLKAINNMHFLEPLFIALYTSVNPVALGKLNMVKNSFTLNRNFDQKVVTKDEPDTIKKLTESILKDPKLSNFFKYNKFSNNSNIIESISIDLPFFINPIYITNIFKIIILIITSTCNFDKDLINPITKDHWINMQVNSLLYGSIINISYEYIELIEHNLCIKLGFIKGTDINPEKLFNKIITELFNNTKGSDDHSYWKYLWDDDTIPKLFNLNQLSWNFNFNHNNQKDELLTEVNEIIKPIDKIYIDDLGNKIKQNPEWSNDSQRLLEYLVSNKKLKRVDNEKKIYYVKI